MKQNVTMFVVALIILSLITAVILGLMAGPDSPLTWLLLILLLTIPYIHNKLSKKKFVIWKADYSVGIDSIDQQHKKLINLINQLQTAVDYSTGEEFEREALDQLVDYTKSHFTFEEGLMEQNGYPDYEPHKAQHVEMIKEVEKVLSMYEEDHDTAMDNALNFLKYWLINHINGTDKEYSHFLISKGVK